MKHPITCKAKEFLMWFLHPDRAAGGNPMRIVALKVQRVSLLKGSLARLGIKKRDAAPHHLPGQRISDVVFASRPRSGRESYAHRCSEGTKSFVAKGFPR